MKRTFTKEFKERIIKEHNETGLSYYALAKKYDLNHNTVYRWIKEPDGRKKSDETLKKDRERDKFYRENIYKRLNFNVSVKVWEEFLNVCALNDTDGSNVLLEYATEFVNQRKEDGAMNE